MNQDLEHLKLLTIFYYIAAGLSALFGFCPGLYVVIGVLMLALGPEAFGPTHHGNAPPPPPAFMGAIFIIFGLLFMAIVWTGAILCYLSARALTNRKRYILCCVTAGLCCTSFPIGTALGVFTFIVLFRPSVKALFQQQPVNEWAEPA